MNHDPLDTCPYDPVHRIIRSRMQFHVTRCAKNHPNAKKETCPYDARHVVDNLDYKYHLSMCPGQEGVWHYHITDQPKEELAKTVPIEPFTAESTNNWEEDWDKDGRVKSYNPLQNIQDRPVTRMAIGLPKSQRKLHRIDERRRFAEIDNQKERSEKAKQQADSKVKNTEKKKTSQANINDQEQEYKPLRRPRKQPQDILNASRASALDTSIASLHQESSLQNASAPVPQTSGHHDKSDNVTPPKDVPFSYSAALNGKSKNNKSNGNVSNTQNSTEREKENIADNSFHNNTADSSVIEKLSSTLNEMAVCDEGHKKKSEKLNKEIDMAKKMNLSKSSANEISSNKFKKLPRCAAKFSSLK